MVFLDQRRLPAEEIDLECTTAAEVAEAIRTLAVRGAPAIGVAAAYGYALAAARGEDLDEAYRVLAHDRGWALIDGKGSVEAVAERVWRAVEPLLEG